MKEILGEIVGSIVAAKVCDNDKHYSFYDSLKNGHKNGVRVIAELKPASPSEGNLSFANFDIENVGSSFIVGGASALSVLVEPMYFGGSFDLINQIRKSIEVPILAKGFIFSVKHIAKCAAVGADAYLLMSRVLETVGTDLRIMIDIGRTLGMEAVVETASSSELESAIAAGAKIVQINARNIYSDLAINLSNIEDARNIPDDVVLIAASGISQPDDMKRVFTLSNNRVDAILVGTSLMKSSDPVMAVRTLVDVGYAIPLNQEGVLD